MQLNKAQQEAVNHVYGPILVLAGPGTGKTQLLSARIAHILQVTDANPQNILCLTFTESAAQNMRERLTRIIKDDAYDVHINTYHGFGSDIIRSYPEYFEHVDLETGKDTRLERPIDELQSLQIVSGIIDSLPYTSPMFGARHYPKNIVHTISELKRAEYTPESLRSLADTNLKQVSAISPKIADHLGVISSFPRTADASVALFDGVGAILDSYSDGLAAIASEELATAILQASELGKSNPLTTWKNKWLTKDENNRFVFTDEAQHLRIKELANIFERYESALADAQLYDFDDMILRTIDALRTKDDLRFTLQEKYQFILLDEFQDTNSAQFSLVKLLADNPVNEGRPDIFAVGDDDQAIYAFQGARVSNMLGFIAAFRDVKVVNLTENYRSHPAILQTADAIATQIESRLHTHIDGVTKTLQASRSNLPESAIIERHEFSAAANEYAWVARKVATLLASGVNPKEIALLAPQHKYLEQAVPFFVNAHIPIAYEKREDILHTALMQAFKTMCELVIAIQNNHTAIMNELFPRVLSLEFFAIPVTAIWNINWTYQKDFAGNWAQAALEDSQLATTVQFFLQLGLQSSDEPLEYMLDYLTGSIPVKLSLDTSFTSPLKEFYFSHNKNNYAYYEALTNLSTIREHIRARQRGETTLLKTQHFLDFIAAYEAADQPLINTHPIALATESVQLMTTYKAKGLEFEHVFLLSVHDDVWGKKARGNSNKFTLPANLTHIRYAGSTEDELRRLLFVAITRAKQGLYLSSHATKDTGKSTEPVKYLLEYDTEDGKRATALPAQHQTVRVNAATIEETMQAVETMWYSRHMTLTADLKSLLQHRLDTYQMSPTHLNTLTDTEYGGPEQFVLQTLLRFPQAPGEDGEYGTAVHTTLDKLQHIARAQWGIEDALQLFDEALGQRYIAPSRIEDFRQRGHDALTSYLAENKTLFNVPAKSEVDFRKEGVLIGAAHLSGKIDRLEIDEEHKTVAIVDFKTGKPLHRWDTSNKALKYKQQLYFYKLLIEGSHTWSKYTVTSARLEFIERDGQKKSAPLYVEFNAAEEAALKELIKEYWQKIIALDF